MKMLNQKRFIYFLFLFYIINSMFIVYGELFTSIIKMKELIETEMSLKTYINSYLQFEEIKLQNLKRMLSEVKTTLTSFQHYDKNCLANPVNIFHLIKDFASISPLINIMNATFHKEADRFMNRNISSLNFPSKEDFTGVAHAMSRLINIYNLNITSFTNGDIFSGITSEQLTGQDCSKIAIQLYKSQMYTRALPWILESLVKLNKEKSTSRKSITEGLAKAAFKTGNKTLQSYVKKMLHNKELNLSSDDISLYQNTFLRIGKLHKTKNVKIHDWSFDPNFDEEHFGKLCRGESLKDWKKETKLKCYTTNNKSPLLIIQPIKVEDIHYKPWIALFHDIITAKEIDVIKKLSTPKLERAAVGGDGETADFRISKSSWLNDTLHPDLHLISQQLQEITGLDVQNGAESLQVVNYGIGGHYENHYDYMDEDELEEDKSKALRNRIATVLIYMSDVIAGGSTVFTKLNLRIVPQKGSAVFWYNLLKNGQNDILTEHGACPVLIGSKWVANKWFMTRNQEFRRPCGLSVENHYEN